MADKVASIVEQLSQQNPFSGAENLPDPPRPSEAAIPRDRPSLEQIPFIQQQISTLTYNHLPRTFFSLEKHRSLQSILLTAKEALSEALPIRCLEATFVALHFTQCLRDVDRIPLSFKSEANGNTYRHIVLVLRTRSNPSLYGALGLSRKSTLMYKPMNFRSLFDVVMDYKHEYAVLGHELVDIKLGIAITHDEHSRWEPCWRFIAVKLSRFCEDATALNGDAAPSTTARRAIASSQSSLTRRNGGPTSDALPRAANGIDGVAAAAPPPPPLALDTPPHDVHAPATRGDGRLERSSNSGVLSSSQNSSPQPLSRRTPSLGASTSALSPNSPRPTTNNSGPATQNNKAESTPESYAPLSRLLSNYTRLLPTICEQYYKTIGTIDASNRALKLCYMDLDTAERDAGMENLRRLQYITDLQSPLSPEARRVAANRQLRAAKKERAASKQRAVSATGSGGDVSCAKRRQASCNEGWSVKRQSPASLALTSSSAAESKKTLLAAGAVATPQCHRSPRTRFTPTTRSTPSAVATADNASGSVVPQLLTAPTSAFPSFVAPPVTLAAALAESSGPRLRSPLTHEGTLIDAHSICSSTSAEQSITEGYVTPRDIRRGAGVGEEVPEVPPLTPRNYDARKPTTPYDAYLRTPSSSSELFSSPTSANITMAAQLTLSP
jgi:tubulinyl-Tyr carboxypeptidase